jgi:hypothetical protein
MGLPAECREAYVRHLVFALLDSAAAGILANAPLMALKGMAGPPWQLALQMTISSVGMFLVLYLGGLMAERRKMPFLVVPGLGYAVCTLGMAFTNNVLAFVVLSGFGALLETVSRPALTAIIRMKYPGSHRGEATGRIRAWCSLVFLATCVGSAWSLDRVAGAPANMIRAQMILAAALSVAGYLVVRTIPLQREEPMAALAGPTLGPMRDAWRIAAGDARFVRYLAIGCLYSLGAMMYVSFIPVLLSSKLLYGYLASSVLLHVVPGVLSFLATGWIGRRIDKINPWAAWRWIRLGWGLDPVLLAAAPALALVYPPGALGLVAIARVLRGGVMGASWILWWQVGVHHFAPPGANTTRYQGMVLFVNGLARMAGPLAGAWLLQKGSIDLVLLAGGLVVLVSAWLSSREYARERKDPRLATIERFEAGPVG